MAVLLLHAAQLHGVATFEGPAVFEVGSGCSLHSAKLVFCLAGICIMHHGMDVLAVHDKQVVTHKYWSVTQA
jgi:hypothetical protein